MNTQRQSCIGVGGFTSCLMLWAVYLGLAVNGNGEPPAPYARAGWEADIFREPRRNNVRGTATIVDERTIRLTHFDYTSVGPGSSGIYGHLGTNNTEEAVRNGPRIGGEFLRSYTNDTLVLQLPEGQTLDGYATISIYCEPVFLNLGSANFTPPVAPRVELFPLQGSDIAILVTGPARRVYRLEASEGTDLNRSWFSLTNFMNYDTSFVFYDASTNSARCYRAVRD